MSYVAVVNVGFVVFFHPVKRKLVRCTDEEFANIYQGIIILIESDGKAGEVAYQFRRRQEKKNEFTANILLCSLPVISIIEIFHHLSSNTIDKEGWYLLFLLLLSHLGWSLSIMLLIYERKTKPDNSLISKVCKRSNADPSSIVTNCHKVLHSASSSLFWVKWSVWGFGYFTALILTQLFFGVASAVVSAPLAGIALSASLYIIYSVYYQWKVLKSWCPMCLIILLTLFLQNLVALRLIQVTSISNFSFGVVLFFFLLIVLITAATEFVTALIDRLRPLKSLRSEYMRNKYDPNVFFCKSQRPTSNRCLPR